VRKNRHGESQEETATLSGRHPVSLPRLDAIVAPKWGKEVRSDGAVATSYWQERVCVDKFVGRAGRRGRPPPPKAFVDVANSTIGKPRPGSDGPLD